VDAVSGGYTDKEKGWVLTNNLARLSYPKGKNDYYEVTAEFSTQFKLPLPHWRHYIRQTRSNMIATYAFREIVKETFIIRHERRVGDNWERKVEIVPVSPTMVDIFRYVHLTGEDHLVSQWIYPNDDRYRFRLEVIND
jgi:hypothetical protein